MPQEMSQSVKQKSKTHPGMITGFGKRKKVEKFDDLFIESDSWHITIRIYYNINNKNNKEVVYVRYFRKEQRITSV